MTAVAKMPRIVCAWTIPNSIIKVQTTAQAGIRDIALKR
jgi:hypothetical protein